MYCMAVKVSMDSSVLQPDVMHCSSGAVLNYTIEDCTSYFCTLLSFEKYTALHCTLVYLQSYLIHSTQLQFSLMHFSILYCKLTYHLVMPDGVGELCAFISTLVQHITFSIELRDWRDNVY